MIRHIVRWFLLPSSHGHYTAWLADWRRTFVALLYPLFDLGLIALVAAGLGAACQELSFSVGATILGCVCFSLWWTRRMFYISGYAFSEKENIDAFEKAIPPEFRDFEHFINSGVGKIPLLVNLWESGYFLLLEGIIRRHYALFMDDLVAIVSLPMFQARAKLLLFLLEKMPVVPFRDILEDILKAIEPSNPPTNECAPSASGEFDNLKKWIHHNIGRDSLRSLPGGAGQAGIGPSIDPKLP